MKKAGFIFTGALILGLQAFSVSSCSSQNQAPAPAGSQAENQSSPDLSKAFLVDVRTPEEFREGTAKGAVNIPLDQIESRLKEFEGKDQIVVFCRSGSRSSQAKAILESQGFINVTNGGTWMDVAGKVGTEENK